MKGMGPEQELQQRGKLGSLKHTPSPVGTSRWERFHLSGTETCGGGSRKLREVGETHSEAS